MATSGSTDFNDTTQSIVQDALLLVKAYDPDETVSPSDLASCKRVLNRLIKYWQVKYDLWVTKDVTVTLTAGTKSYTVGSGLDVDTPRPLRLISARRRDTSGTEIEAEVVSRQRYMQLPEKTTQGPVNTVYYDPQLANGVLYVWPTGNSGNLTLVCTFQRPIEDFDANTDDPDLPQEWLSAIVDNLAVEIWPQYRQGDPPQWLTMRAVQKLETLDGWDEEPNSLFIQPGKY